MVSPHQRVCRTIYTGGKQMSAATRARAPSGVTWDGINWANVQRQVRGLQTRMVKAVQAGRHNRVKALQWLLTHSFSGRALAVKRVTENKGRNTPGVDKVIWKTPAAKTNAIASLKRRGYSTPPLRRVLIPKDNGKMRALGIPVMKCRAQQALHLLMKPSKANVKAHLDKIREVIKANQTAKQTNLIRLLNPVLRGWANYHSHVVAKETFGRIDSLIWSMLWRWAVRRHPNKGRRWVKDKYFPPRGPRHWVFAAIEKKKDGSLRDLVLLKESDTPIQRHIKIKAAVNPYDPQWDQYF